VASAGGRSTHLHMDSHDANVICKSRQSGRLCAKLKKYAQNANRCGTAVYSVHMS
jgi:hypothetical protein